MPGAEGRLRPAWAEIDLDALAHNVGVVRAHVAPAQLCAVVKADGYGHGSVAIARTAVAAGAQWLAVALPEEGIELRRAGIRAPILVLSEPPAAAAVDLVESGLTPTVYTAEGVEAVAAAASALGVDDVSVHLKVDTGMHRVGVSPEGARDLALAVRALGRLRLEGLWTHLAVADQPADPLTGTQLERFESVCAELGAAGASADLRHAANSAGAIWHPRSHLDLVRCGLALYGYQPSPGPGPGAGLDLRPALDLRPVLSLRSRITFLRQREAGARVSYGQRRPLPGRSWVATVPIGYGDGVPRRLFDAGMGVLIGGRRRQLAGTVTMDQILVDCGPVPDVAVGDEVVLLGTQGTESVTADDWAAALGTISYEVLCGIGRRVPRVPTS